MSPTLGIIIEWEENSAPASGTASSQLARANSLRKEDVRAEGGQRVVGRLFYGYILPEHTWRSRSNRGCTGRRR